MTDVEIINARMNLIDRDALAELIDCGYDLDFDEVPETKRELIRMVMEQPTVDAVEVKHGEWQWIGDSEEPQDGVFMCSVCGGFLYDVWIDDCKWCPYCGAKMDAAGDGQNNKGQ